MRTRMHRARMGGHYTKGQIYGRQWRALRLMQLAREPLCRFCGLKGALTAATVVDHVTPHRGNRDLFYRLDNLQSLCKPCHDSAKQRQEKAEARGPIGCDAEGYPLSGEW
jgi:5-methylcytosine-specific restriction endonuclease McrA